MSQDEGVLLASEFSPNEINLFFGLVAELMEHEEVNVAWANNLGPEFQVKVANAGRAIQKMCNKQWLKVTRQGRTAKLVFGARALLELPAVRTWALNFHLEKDGEEQGNVEEQGIVEQTVATRAGTKREKRKTRKDFEREDHMDKVGSSQIQDEDLDDGGGVQIKRGRRRRK